MPLSLNGTLIEQVGVVDDSEDMRETIGDELRDADFIPRLFEGPFRTADQLVTTVMSGSQAVVCDHQLSPRNFAPCSGAEAVAAWYDRHFPSVLITRYSRSDIDQIRPYRRYIPVLLSPEEANPETISKGFEICFNEFHDRFLPSRRPWKTLLMIEDVDNSQRSPLVYAVVPAWNSEVGVRFPLNIIGPPLREHVRPEEYFYAMVNIGAESQEELYFENFEYRGRQ
jgi:hypothetical protein